MSEQVVIVSNVGRVFSSGTKKDRKEFVALDDVSFTVNRGEFVSLLGPSGCGKSTLLKIVSGLLKASSGTVEITEKENRKTPPFGFVFQDSVLLPWRTAIENALFPFEIMGNKEKADESNVRNLFELAKLVGFENSYPRQLSGGMRQRVAIVRALSYNPPILLMDEPFGALDAITRDNLNNVLLEIWESTRKTVIFVTHSISEAVYLSDRIIVMGTKPGRVVADMKVELPRPRNEDSKLTPEFYSYVKELREMLK
ncbi:MAG: ABC transporter ATP-binding protein [Thermotogaceae bacterium]|nr:ABC transporter ATP-binding protein [Thermotogota bacterium]NLT45403.1 ABC transporter ATP-binding protein [Thermotogaceae bacterium]